MEWGEGQKGLKRKKRAGMMMMMILMACRQGGE